MTTSRPNPGSGPENLGLGQMWSLLVVLEGAYIKRDHINHGFGPDVIPFGVPHLAQTQVLGPKTWVWARCGLCWLFWMAFARKHSLFKPLPKQSNMTTSGPNPGSGPENLGLGQMWWSSLSCPNISCKIGSPFWLDWGQGGSKTQGNPSKMTLDTVLCAG